MSSMSVRVWLPLGALVSALLLSCCGGPAESMDPGARARLDETRRVVDVVSRAISAPRQDSAAGFARAADRTTAAEDGRLAVIGMDDLDPEELEDPLARLTFRVHLAGSGEGLGTRADVTACYVADFSRYGVIGSPRQVDCPAHAAAVSVPPAPAVPVVPAGAEARVRAALRAAAGPASPDELRAEILRRVSALVTDPAPSQPPDVTVTVQGADVGAALAGAHDCLLARRVAGTVEAWRPPSVTVEPGELSCSAGTALAGLAKRSPH